GSPAGPSVVQSHRDPRRGAEAAGEWHVPGSGQGASGEPAGDASRPGSGPAPGASAERAGDASRPGSGPAPGGSGEPAGDASLPGSGPAPGASGELPGAASRRALRDGRRGDADCPGGQVSA